MLVLKREIHRLTIAAQEMYIEILHAQAGRRGRGRGRNQPESAGECEQPSQGILELLVECFAYAQAELP